MHSEVKRLFRNGGSIFFRKRESDCIVFPTSIECSFKRKARNIFSDEKQKTSSTRKLRLILADLLIKLVL